MNLWRDKDFMMLWTGQTVSEFGSRITRTGLPIVAWMTLHVSAAQMGVLTAAGLLPTALFGLVAGAWLDRVRRRPVMICADLARALLIASVPVAALMGSLGLPQLYLVVAGVGFFTLLFNVAYRSYMPSLVDRKNLAEGNRKLSLSSSLAEVGGPGLAGVMIKALTVPVAMIADAASFLVSAFSLLFIRRHEPLPERTGPADIKAEVLAGLRFMLATPILRASATASAMQYLFFGIFGALYTLYAMGQLHIEAPMLGVIISVGGVAALAGSLLADKIVRRIGLGPTLVLAPFLTGCAALFMPLAGFIPKYAPYCLMAAQLGDSMLVVYGVHDLTLRQSVTPDAMLGRMNAAMNLTESGMLPLGALLGGLLGEWIGLQSAIGFAAAGSFMASAFIFFSPIRHLNRHSNINPEQAPPE